MHTTEYFNIKTTGKEQFKVDTVLKALKTSNSTGARRTKVHFQPSEEILHNLINDAARGGLDHYTEIFLDTPDYHLLQRGCWLRNINDNWTLKQHISGNQSGEVTYNELKDEKKILEFLRATVPGAHHDDIFDCCPVTIAAFETTRLFFHGHDTVRIYLDCVQLGATSYFLVGTVESYDVTERLKTFQVDPALSKIIFYLNQKPQVPPLPLPNPSVVNNSTLIFKTDVLLLQPIAKKIPDYDAY